MVATGLGAGVALLMAGALVHGLTAGNVFDEGAWLLSLAWGRVTVIDVYAGLLLFAAWIGWRESRAWVAGAWIVALCLLGNLAAGCYVVLAACGSRGSALRFWLGSRRAGGGSTSCARRDAGALGHACVRRGADRRRRLRPVHRGELGPPGGR